MNREKVFIVKREVINSFKPRNEFEQLVSIEAQGAIWQAKNQIAARYNQRETLLSYQATYPDIWAEIDKVLTHEMPVKSAELSKSNVEFIFNNFRYKPSGYNPTVIDIEGEGNDHTSGLNIAIEIDYDIDEFTVVKHIGSVLYLATEEDVKMAEVNSGEVNVFRFEDGENGFYIKSFIAS